MRPARTLLALGALTTILFACSSDGDGRRWADAADQVEPAVPGTTIIDTGAVRVVEQIDRSCAQLTIADTTLTCLQTSMAEGFGHSARALRVGDLRVVDLRTGPDATDFVVWSSVSPGGRSIEPIAAAGSSILVWIMQPGEEPWGVQVIGPGGFLGTSVSFVGLPGA